MKRMVQGMMVALVCGAAFLTGCSSKDGDKTVFLDDYEKNIANKIVGKWINVEEAGKAVPTNLKGVMTIESFSKGYYSTSFGSDTWIEREAFEIAIKRDTISWAVANGPVTVNIQHIVNSVTDSEMNTTTSLVAKMGDSVVSEVGPMSMRLVKLAKDYRQDIIGPWEGKVSSDSSQFDDGQLHRWEYRADGNYVYYGLVKDKWEPIGGGFNQYLVDGNLLCTRWKNEGDEQESREWWEIESIEDGVMKWKALRIGEDGAPYAASFTMTKVNEPQ
jgi:hypothetical protein